jgi:septal ring factor EnvC (AmiA/AmiB activator)
MLNELETLSQNIGRLIAISQRHQEARQALEAQLAQSRAEGEATRVALDQMRDERNALQADRDALSAKIDDAQVRLNAILEKLPRGRTHSDTDSQLDLLVPAYSKEDTPGEAARRGENA